MRGGTLLEAGGNKQVQEFKAGVGGWGCNYRKKGRKEREGGREERKGGRRKRRRGRGRKKARETKTMIGQQSKSV